MKNRKKIDRRSLAVEGLEERRVLAASVGWDGPGQGSADLTYYIGQAPNGMSQSTFEAAIETALKAWSDVADINFAQTNQPGLNNSLDFTSKTIDGSGGTLAQAYFPADANRSRIAGDVQFDSAERWEVGNGQGASAFDIVLVAAHEIGHALGLDHSSDGSAVLYPSVSPTQSFVGLDADDIEAIQSLYAAKPGSTTDSGTDSGSDSGTGTDTDTTTDTNTGTSGSTPTNPTKFWPTRTTRFTPNSWFANWQNRLGGFRGGIETLDADAPINHNLFNPLDVNTDDNVSPADALLVINILNDDGKLTTEIKVDTNGDGQITPLDALLVINGLGEEQSTTTITIDLSGESPFVTVVTTPISGSDDGTVDSGDDSSIGDDPVDDSDIDDSTDVDDSIDIGDTDDSDSGTDTDTGTGTDDNTDDDEDTDVPFDYFGHQHHRFGGFGFGTRFGFLSPERVDSLFERFDTNTDDLLTEDEVPSRLWAHWSDDGVDTNADLAISVNELNAAVRAKQQEKFDALDDDSDGLLTETEVSSRLWTKLTDAEADTDADGGISLDELLAFQETATTLGGSHCEDDSTDDSDDDSTTGMTTLAEVAARNLASSRNFQSNVLVQMASALRSMGRRFR